MDQPPLFCFSFFKIAFADVFVGGVVVAAVVVGGVVVAAAAAAVVFVVQEMWRLQRCGDPMAWCS